MQLKDQHYAEQLQMLTECAPSSARNVELERDNLTAEMNKLEIERKEREAEMEAERVAWEEAEKERIAREMDEFQKKLDEDIKLEEQKVRDSRTNFLTLIHWNSVQPVRESLKKVQNELEAKQAQQQKLENERKQMLENEFKEKIASSNNAKARFQINAGLWLVKCWAL